MQRPELVKKIWRRRFPIFYTAIYFAVAGLAIVLGLVKSGGVATPSPIASASAGPSASASAGPSAAASPQAVSQVMADQIGSVSDSAIHLLLALLILFVVIPGAVILFIVALQRLRAILRRQQLVIPDMANATGLTELNDTVGGLSQLLREGVHRALSDLAARQDPNDKGSRRKTPAPTSSVSSDLSTLVSGLKDSAPSQVRPLLGVIPVLFPPSGTRVDSYLARSAAAPLKFSLSVQVADLADGSGITLDSLGGLARPPAEDVLPVPTVIRHQPITEAEGHYITGLALENAGRIAEAMTSYEAAIAADPKWTPAYVGLERAARVQTPNDQARAFVDDAARWLGVLLLRRQLLSDPDTALGQNIMGVELVGLAGSVTMADPEPLYRQAIVEFKQAHAAEPMWYRPLENLGDALSYLGEYLNETSYQWDALRQYNLALLHVARRNSRDDNDPDPERKERIELSRGIARLLTRQAEQIDKAEEEYGAQADVLDLAHLYRHKKSESLYTVACWWATHARVNAVDGAMPPDDVRQVSEYLAFALAVVPEMASWATADPDFSELAGIATRLARASGWLAFVGRDGEIDSVREFADLVASDWARERRVNPGASSA